MARREPVDAPVRRGRSLLLEKLPHRLSPRVLRLRRRATGHRRRDRQFRNGHTSGFRFVAPCSRLHLHRCSARQPGRDREDRKMVARGLERLCSRRRWDQSDDFLASNLRCLATGYPGTTTTYYRPFPAKKLSGHLKRANARSGRTKIPPDKGRCVPFLLRGKASIFERDASKLPCARAWSPRSLKSKRSLVDLKSVELGVAARDLLL